MPPFWQVHSIGGASPRHPKELGYSEWHCKGQQQELYPQQHLLLQFPYKYTRDTKYARIESYGSQKPFQMQESKKFLLCLFFRFFLSKYSTLNHSEAPCRKAKTRNYMNRTANITNPPTLLDRKACKGSPSERLVNTRILTLLSRNRNREHLSQQELNPWLFHFYFLISFGNHVPEQILVNTYNKLVVETLSATLAAVS